MHPIAYGGAAMTKPLFIVPLVGLVAMVFAATSPTQQIPRELKGREFMHRKLDHSQKVLEGIVEEDFDLVEKNAKTLSLLSQAAEWQVLPSAEYKQHSAEFRRNADALAKAAADKNLDGAALKYVELTLNCVNCHKHVRTFRPEDPKKPIEEAKGKLLLDEELRTGKIKTALP
jgi:hypothetical protein